MAMAYLVRENEYILSCYRPTSGSVAKSLHSLFYVHNETVSIYSHLIGALLFALLPYLLENQIYSFCINARPIDLAVFSIYALGTATCFVLSSTCHVVWNCTPAWAFYGNQLDYLGIILLMWSASVPTIYYGFYFDAHLQKTYWTLMSVATLICSAITMSAKFSKPMFRTYRVAMYGTLGATTLIFVAHGILLHGWEVQKNRMSLMWMLWMATFNFTGAAVYAARIPERWFPYTFDIYGASHQIFHVMVILAGLVHFAGLLQALDATHQ